MWGGCPSSFRTGPPQLGANVFFYKQGRLAVTGGFLLGSSDDYGRSLAISWQMPSAAPDGRFRLVGVLH